MKRYLRSSPVIDSDHPDVKSKARELTEGIEDRVECAIRLFYAVRDGIRYNFYPPSVPPPLMFKASHTLSVKEGFCIPKAILLVALGRAVDIPGALGFADIRNHRLPPKVVELMGGNVIRLHGFAELYIEGKWLKVTPAFDLAMCRQNRLTPVEFNGRTDAMFSPLDQDGRPFIEYLNERCHYLDDVEPHRLMEALTRGFEEG
ncbi:MAG: transglutaminase family protein [Desulfosalsimonadaceae bacterium]